METYLNVDCKECQYKDTGECEEFKDECKAVSDFKVFVKNMYSKLKDYENLEEQGKLLKLPCAVGDMVYDVIFCGDEKYRIFEMKVCNINLFGDVRKGKIWNVYLEDDCTKAYRSFYDFGKTVFLTREEAETTLNKLEVEG